MTKEALKKEAKEYVCKRNPFVTKEWFIDAFKKYDKGEKVKYLNDCEIAEYEAYLAGSEPREKQIQIDAEQIRALQKQNGELTDELKLTNKECKDMREELKQRIRENQKLCEQIEKMKRCAICKYSTDLGYCKIRCSGGECDNYSSWEIKENE